MLSNTLLERVFAGMFESEAGVVCPTYLHTPLINANLASLSPAGVCHSAVDIGGGICSQDRPPTGDGARGCLRHAITGGGAAEGRPGWPQKVPHVHRSWPVGGTRSETEVRSDSALL